MAKKKVSRSRRFPDQITSATARVARLRDAVADYIEDEAFDRRLDQSVDFLAANGFGGAQFKYLFGLSSRRQKFLYIASVTGATVAVTLFSQGLIGRTLKRVPFLRWS